MKVLFEGASLTWPGLQYFFSLAASIPSLPFLIGLVVFFQLTKWIFFLLLEEPHKKLRLNLSMLFKILIESAAHCIA